MIRYEAELRLSATAAWRLSSAPGDGCKTCRGLILKCPIWHLFSGRFTHAPSDACRGVFFSKGENHERANLMMKSLSVILNAPLGSRTPAEPDRPPSLFRERKGPKRRKTDAEGLPWTFWCSMRWQSHMNKRKMPGWRWCFSIPNMMERQSEVRVWHRQR